MPRANTIVLVLAIVAAFIAAALLGRAAAPRGAGDDERPSTRLATQRGARAFRTALERFGVDVTERRRPFFDLERTLPADPSLLLVVLKPMGRITLPERRAVRDWVARGGRLLAAGPTGIEHCFGLRVKSIADTARSVWDRDDGGPWDSTAVQPPRAVLRRFDPFLAEQGLIGTPEVCEIIAAASSAVLWRHGKADTAAIRYDFASGGSATFIADVTPFTNRALRRSDAGVMVMGWVLARAPRAVVIDEYHQGFGPGGSLPGAVAARATRSPAGWMVLQLIAATLLALTLAAIRFGPALSGTGHRRRSPLEHLDALAIGLERSAATPTAIRLLVAGLRRRLAGSAVRSRTDALSWLASLESGARSPDSRAAIERLRQLTRADARGTVLQAAQAVEDVWKTLKVPAPRRS